MNRQILLWIQNGKVVKGEIDFTAGTVTFYDKFNNILMYRAGLSAKQLTEIQRQAQKQLSKRERVGFYYV